MDTSYATAYSLDNQYYCINVRPYLQSCSNNLAVTTIQKSKIAEMNATEKYITSGHHNNSKTLITIFNELSPQILQPKKRGVRYKSPSYKMIIMKRYNQKYTPMHPNNLHHPIV
jgi:uncharacterized membrane-anchored protein